MSLLGSEPAVLEPAYVVLETLYQSAATAVYRGRPKTARAGMPETVILKVCQQDSEAAAVLRREYALLQTLEPPHIIRAYSLEVYPPDDPHILCLVLENRTREGVDVLTLRQVLAQQQGLVAWLKVACYLADALTALHAQDVIHCDINPSNVLVERHLIDTSNTSIAGVTLIDFGAAQHSNEQQTSHVRIGTLAYLAPEQSGRSRREVDARSDLYSLGVTLYELFSGQLPFVESEPSALVHAHLTRTPAAPEGVPQVLSRIVLKLLEKDPDARYPNAAALSADLYTCLQYAQSNNVAALADMPLAGQTLTLPRWLPGREAVFVGVKHQLDQSPRQLIVAEKGAGKSYLLRLLEQDTLGACVFFRVSEASTAAELAAAFAQPLDAILHADDTSLQTYRRRLQEALGEDATILARYLPNLAQVLGLPSPAVDVRPNDETVTEATSTDWREAWLTLVRVLAEAGLTVLIDDVHVASKEVWGMLEHLAQLSASIPVPSSVGLMPARLTPARLTPVRSSARSFVRLIVTCVPSAGKLPDFLDGWLEHRLTDLDDDMLQTLCQQLTLVDAAAVAAWLARKTAGNPAALTDLMQHCINEGIIRSSLDTQANALTIRWTCDIPRLAACPLSAKVARLRAATLQQRSQAERALLAVLACWHTGVTDGVLEQADVLAVTASLTDTLQVSAPWADVWQALLEADYLRLVDTHTATSQVATFAHPELQQAAYDGCETYARDYLEASYLTNSDTETTFASRLHHAIGQYLARRDEAVASTLHQATLHQATLHHRSLGMVWLDTSELHTLSRQLLALADSTLADNTLADNTLAVAGQARWLRAALRALHVAYGEQMWREDYDLTLTLHQQAAEVAYHLHDDNWLQDMTETVLRERHRVLDSVEIYASNILRQLALGKHEAVIDWVRRAFADFGQPFEREPHADEVQNALLTLKAQVLAVDKAGDGAALLALPTMTDPEALAQSRLLALMSGSAFALSSRLYALTVIIRMGLLLEHGHSEFSPAIFAAYGLLLAGQDEHLAHSYHMGTLAEKLLQSMPEDPHRARTMLMINVFLRHWREPLHNTIAGLFATAEAGRAVDNANYMVRSWVARVRIALAAGEDLASLEDDVRTGLSEAKQRGQSSSFTDFGMILQMVRVLRDPQAAEPHALGKHIVGEYYDEHHMGSEHITANSGAAYVFYSHKVMLLVLFGYYHEALTWLELTQHSLQGRESTNFAPMFVFYEALVLLATYETASEAVRPDYLRRAEVACERLATWAQFAPTNYQHRLLLLEAEIAHVQGDNARARERFDAAIDAAKRSRFQHEYALALERAATYYEALGLDRYAKVLWQDALDSYRAWGADAKVAQLRFLHPAWLQTSTVTTYATTGSSIALPDAASLDISTLMQASQAIAQHLELADVLRDVLRLSAETAAAQKAVLVLLEDDALVVEGWYSSDACEVRLELPLADAGAHVPASVVRFVVRSQEPVLLNDAAHQGRFRDDPYIVREQVSSLLGMPVTYQNRLTGVLYLEHRSLRGAFDEGRLQVLELLLGQAAISLENARLYGKQDMLLTELSQTLADLQATQGQLAQFEAEQAAVRYIQRVLLPSQDELDEYASLELAGLSESADEVGGDYFDVLPLRVSARETVLKIIIGDVTGHGLQSGMLMLMAQTAVRTLVSEQQVRGESLSARHFLDVLNRSLHANLQRSHIDKSMTLLSLDYHGTVGGARVRLSGQHEHLIIVRQSGHLEIIDTLDLGFPLGLTDDIADFVAETWFDLASGDGIALYTDGITEAENIAGEQYGEARLLSTLQRHWLEPLQAVVAAVRSDVHAHIGEQEVFDDITLLLLKQR